MATLLLSIAVLGASVFLFRIALPRDGKPRWFIGTVWEPYIVVALVTASVVSAGLALWNIVELLS
jgi:hypothetical protein